VYETEVALKAIAIRLDQSLNYRPSVERGEIRMTTDELRDAGLAGYEAARFTVRMPVIEGDTDIEDRQDAYLYGVALANCEEAPDALDDACSWTVVERREIVRGFAEVRGALAG